jgi:hypothetical protein
MRSGDTNLRASRPKTLMNWACYILAGNNESHASAQQTEQVMRGMSDPVRAPSPKRANVFQIEGGPPCCRCHRVPLTSSHPSSLCLAIEHRLSDRTFHPRHARVIMRIGPSR